MNIWLIQTGEPFPTDDSVKQMRTSLLADKLVEKGHSVIWWTSAFDHIKKKWIFTKDTEIQKKDGLTILALKGTGYKNNISLMRFIDHRIVAWKFYRMAGKMAKPDFIIASMPPHDFAYQAVMFAKNNNIPILVDIRDPWPDIFLEHIPSVLRRVAKIVLLNEFNMVKKITMYANGLIAVTESFLKWGLLYANRKITENDKVFFLGYKKQNNIDLSRVNPKFIELEKELKNKFIIFFVGTLSKSYHNPLILVKAAEIIKEYKDIHFLIAGEGELYQELLSASENNSNLTITGWLNQQEIEFWLKHSKIGVCPARKPVYLPTNKAFTYLSAGLPVISAFQGELKEIIEKYQIGFYYTPNDVNAIVNYIKILYQDSNLYDKMSENAKKVFEEMFDADKIYGEYANHIEQITENIGIHKS
ncbi:MAG: glycosyltransferase WbuB [Bacteroidetes bacterium]|nr:MAG: glycosyltransferase WbuB [Bacteroidota bacterium]